MRICETLCRFDPKFGYYPERSKTWLIVTNNAKKQAEPSFKHANLKIKTEDHLHLGAVNGITNFKQNYEK